MKSTSNLIIGATGKVGSQVIQFFSKAGISCTALTRDLSKSAITAHVNWIQGDLKEKQALPGLLNGTETIFLNTAVSDDMLEMQCNLIDAAKQAGVNYIVKLSTPSASATATDKPGKMHWQIEEHLKQSGILWNSLRPQSFMQNWLGDLASIVRTERKIYAAAGDGKKAFIDVRDIGEVTFNLMCDPKNHFNNILPLSGPAAVNFHELASVISETINEEVIYVAQSFEEAKTRMQKRGTPEWAIQLTLTVEKNQQSGAAEKVVSTTVRDILGKPARSISEFVRDYAKAFK